jgi:hypothetical protein
MGVYYKWICRERKEQLCPSALDESVKHPFAPKTMIALEYAVMFGPWAGRAIELLSDHGDMFYEIDEGDAWPDIAVDSYAWATRKVGGT